MPNLRLVPIGRSRVSGMLKIAGAQTLDLFAIATQERCKPEAGGSNDRYETMRPTPKSLRPKSLRPMSHNP
jgi:hypothetical protein